MKEAYAVYYGTQDHGSLQSNYQIDDGCRTIKDDEGKTHSENNRSDTGNNMKRKCLLTVNGYHQSLIKKKALNS